jgi:hypothetical protein
MDIQEQVVNMLMNEIERLLEEGSNDEIDTFLQEYFSDIPGLDMSIDDPPRVLTLLVILGVLHTLTEPLL